MIVRKPIIIIGAAVFISGIIFHFQGQGIVGPESSFMYSNPEWITYGLGIVILGVIILSGGIWLTILKKH